MRGKSLKCTPLNLEWNSSACFLTISLIAEHASAAAQALFARPCTSFSFLAPSSRSFAHQRKRCSVFLASARGPLTASSDVRASMECSNLAQPAFPQRRCLWLMSLMATKPNEPSLRTHPSCRSSPRDCYTTHSFQQFCCLDFGWMSSSRICANSRQQHQKKARIRSMELRESIAPCRRHTMSLAQHLRRPSIRQLFLQANEQSKLPATRGTPVPSSTFAKDDSMLSATLPSRYPSRRADVMISGIMEKSVWSFASCKLPLDTRDENQCAISPQISALSPWNPPLAAAYPSARKHARSNSWNNNITTPFILHAMKMRCDTNPDETCLSSSLSNGGG